MAEPSTRTRASIDPLTNIIRPRGVRLRRDIKGLLVGPWAPSSVQPFVHELTHHWCFHSEVGAIIACIHFRAIRQLFSSAVDGEKLFDDMLTVDAMLRLLQPLSEGLALFAEYDIALGASSVVTTPLFWSAIATSERASLPLFTNEKDAAEFNERLRAIRLRREAIERKMSLLSCPLSPLEETYFDGYLMVKRIHADLRKRVPAFADTDLFLSYLRSFFFEDQGTTAILTRPYENPYVRVRDLIGRYGSRLSQLYEGDLANDVARFEAATNGPPGDDRDFDLPGLRVSEAERAEAAKGRGAFMAEFEDDPGLPDDQRALLNVQRGWFSRRSLVFVATERAHVMVRNGSVQAWPDPKDEDYPLLIGGALPGIADTPGTDGPSPGWISFLLHPTLYFYTPVVGIDDRLVAIVRPPESEDVRRSLEEIVDNPHCSPTIIEQQRAAVEQWREGYFRDLPEPVRSGIEQVRGSIDDALRQASDAFLERWGTHGGSAARLRSGNRFWDLFSGDRKMFETFLVLGLFQDRDVLEPRWMSAFAQADVDVGRAFMTAMTIDAETGISLVANDNGVFRWLV